MTEIIQKDKCCGCAACANICPVDAIVMKADQEGFLYPEIGKCCIDCGMCQKTCPVINVKKEEQFEQIGYAVQNKNEQILRESTSGGAFTAIAESIIKKGGVVFGAAFDDDLTVKHISVDNINDLSKFRNSKYVQSEIGTSYSEAKKLLDDNVPVCFSGTPCQIEGLISFLKKPYDNLITVDIVCHAVPSPLIYKKYLSFRSADLTSSIKSVIFRDKYYGYKYSALSIYNDQDKNIYHNGIDTDEMMRAFFSNICDRPSCYHCVFKKRYRVSDFTLWDCFDVDEIFPEADNDKGATKLLIQTEKGRAFFENVKPMLNFKQVSPEMLVIGSKEMTASVEQNPKRADFFRDAAVLSDSELFKKYFPINFISRFEKTVRLISNKLGVYKFVRKAYKNMFGDRKR